jgi:RHS repeat-associated protein
MRIFSSNVRYKILAFFVAFSAWLPVTARGDNGAIVQRLHYYPYGSIIKDESSGYSFQPYKFGGKEEEPMHGLNLYDFGARQLDYSYTSRFTTMDPLAEKKPWLSPYAYCANNPVRFIDPDGRKFVYAANSTQNFKNDVVTTIKFMNRMNTSGIIKQIMSHSKTITIKETTEDSKFNPNSNIIHWNPTMGVLTDNGVVISPATVLNHEADHALQELNHPEQKAKDRNIPDTNYGNKEEKRVITGTEQETAKKHGEIKEGEVTRTNHGGTRFDTKSPTTTTGKYEVEVTAQQKRKEETQ